MQTCAECLYFKKARFLRLYMFVKNLPTVFWFMSRKLNAINIFFKVGHVQLSYKKMKVISQSLKLGLLFVTFVANLYNSWNKIKSTLIEYSWKWKIGISDLSQRLTYLILSNNYKCVETIDQRFTSISLSKKKCYKNTLK